MLQSERYQVLMMNEKKKRKIERHEWVEIKKYEFVGNIAAEIAEEARLRAIMVEQVYTPRTA